MQTCHSNSVDLNLFRGRDRRNHEIQPSDSLLSARLPGTRCVNLPMGVKALAIVLAVLAVLVGAIYGLVDRAQITPEEGLEALE